MSIRQEFSQEFIEAFRADCQRQANEPPEDLKAAGIEECTNIERLIALVREQEPGLYLRTAVQLVPRQLEIGASNSLVQMLEDWRDRSDEITHLNPYALPKGARQIEAKVEDYDGELAAGENETVEAGANGQERSNGSRPAADPGATED